MILNMLILKMLCVSGKEDFNVLWKYNKVLSLGWIALKNEGLGQHNVGPMNSTVWNEVFKEETTIFLGLKF